MTIKQKIPFYNVKLQRPNIEERPPVAASGGYHSKKTSHMKYKQTSSSLGQKRSHK